jgi:DNA-binding HxlR family transcriptional regulator
VAGSKSQSRGRAASAPRSRKAAIPSPGEIFDPVARALEVIGDRWSLVLVRQLLLGPKGFQELRVRTGIAPRVLSGRLRQLAAAGFVETDKSGGRSLYTVAPRGRSLEPIISSIARWWVRQGVQDLEIDASRFSATSPQSIVESLPFLLREERARGAHVTFEIRLTGEGGGVWTVEIDDGQCRVHNDFADHADVRYTADARVWCAVALGMLDARDAVKRDLMTKDGAPDAMDHYFHQIARSDLDSDRTAKPTREAAGGDRPSQDERPPPRASDRRRTT